jgi:hypothetical protein
MKDADTIQEIDIERLVKHIYSRLVCEKLQFYKTIMNSKDYKYLTESLIASYDIDHNFKIKRISNYNEGEREWANSMYRLMHYRSAEDWGDDVRDTIKCYLGGGVDPDYRQNGIAKLGWCVGVELSACITELLGQCEEESI